MRDLTAAKPTAASAKAPRLAHRSRRSRTGPGLVTGLLMRAGLVFSAVGHLALLVWGFVLFASPKQFAPIPPESITVDIVPAAAMAQGSEEQPRAESAAAQPQRAPDREQLAAQVPAGDSQTGTASPQPSAQAQRPGPREPIQARPPPPEPPPPPPNPLV